MSSHKKISILGSGRVGSSIAYSLILEGLCSEIVLVDIAKELAQGESYAPDAIYIIVSTILQQVFHFSDYLMIAIYFIMFAILFFFVKKKGWF